MCCCCRAPPKSKRCAPDRASRGTSDVVRREAEGRRRALRRRCVAGHLDNKLGGLRHGLPKHARFEHLDRQRVLHTDVDAVVRVEECLLPRGGRERELKRDHNLAVGELPRGLDLLRQSHQLHGLEVARKGLENAHRVGTQLQRNGAVHLEIDAAVRHAAVCGHGGLARDSLARLINTVVARELDVQLRGAAGLAHRLERFLKGVLTRAAPPPA